MVLLALLAAVHGVTPRQAPSDIEVHVAVSTENVTVNPGGSTDVSLSLDVQGAPVEHSECTVQGTGTPGPWSGPTYYWDAPTSSDPSGVDAQLDANASSVSNTLHLQFFKAGDYTVTVTGGVKYTSSCGPAAGSDTRTIHVHVNGKVWDVGTPIEPGTATASGADAGGGSPATIDWNQTAQVSVEGAHDSDHWTNGADSGTEDDELTYQWSGQGTFATPDAASSQWTPPTLPSDNASFTYKLFCTVDDKPKELGAGEGGTRDDSAPEHLMVEVKVTRKKWDVGSAIQLGGPITSDVTGQASLQGEAKLYVEQGQQVHVTIPTATDSDHWVYRDTQGTEPDEVNYHWNSTDNILAGAEGQSVTWTAPALPPGIASASFTLTCIVDDKPTPIDTANGETGKRDDDANDKSTISFVVVRRMWSPNKGIGYHPQLDAQGQFDKYNPTWVPDGQVVSPSVSATTNKASAMPGEHVACALSEAHDWDSWTKGDMAGAAGADLVEDSPLTYHWTATQGQFLVGEGANAQLQSSADTREAVWVAPTDGTNGPVTLTCTVDDPAGDRVNAPLEGGSRDDGALVRTVVVDVVPSYWSVSDKEIGFHPKRDTNNQIIEPHEWLPDGRLTTPLDQTVENPASEKSVAPGESVPCAVEAAQDWDTLTTKDGKSIAQDDTLTYTWSADKGKFRVTHEDGTTTDEAQASGQSATWIAPDDVTEDTDAQLKCTIDDAEGDRVTAPIGGSHDDEKLERTAKIKMMVPKVTFTQMDGTDLPSSGARSCAGGVGLDGVHDFTILATAKRSDGTIVPNAEFKLSFENNKGHDYGDGSEKKTAKFVTTDENGNPKLVETLTVHSDDQGQFPTHVLSSDIVSTDIKIKVKRATLEGQDVDAGEQACDFGAITGKRGWPNQYDPQDTSDDGWLFNKEWLPTPGLTTTVKLYLQFKIDPNGTDDDSNWKRVNGHNIAFEVDHIDLRDELGGQGTPVEDYAFVVNEAHPEAHAIVMATRNDGSVNGAATAVVQAGPKIQDTKKLWIYGYDLSQWDR